MVAPQAQKFAEDYLVVDQRPNTAEGFSAAVFKRGDEYFLSVRGTEQIWTRDGLVDWNSNLNQVGRDGIAAGQAVDLFNYLQDLTAQQDSVVRHYTYNRTTRQVTYSTSIAAADGVLFNKNFSVTGHSLGGQLALVASRLLPDRVNAAYSFNPPGFDTTFPFGQPNFGSELFFSALRQAEIGATGISNIGTSFDVAKITNIAVPDDIVHRIGNVPGSFLPVFSEGSGAVGAHLIGRITDTLALCALLQVLDRSKSDDEVLASSIDILRASSNSISLSLETTIDAVGNILKLGRTISADDSSELHQSVARVRDVVIDTQTGRLREQFQDLSLLSLVPVSAPDIAAQALTSLAYRYALAELNPFAIVGSDSLYNAPIQEAQDPHNVNGRLDLFDTSQRKGWLTPEYIAERSAFLAFKNAAYLADSLSVVLPTAPDNRRYTDLTRNLQIQVFGSAPVTSQRQFIFGGDSADRLEGGRQDDRFYGGAGTDYLIGRGGDDYEEGGRGLDLYRFGATQRLTFGGFAVDSDGADEIRDIDGMGVLRYVYTPVFGVAESAAIADTSLKINESTWQSADGKFTYVKQGADLVVTINVNGGGSMRLLDFRDGDLGIHLWAMRAEPATQRTLEGDLRPLDGDPTKSGDQLVYDAWGNIATTAELVVDRDDGLFGRDDAIGDLIVAGGGNDIVYGDTPAMAAPGPRMGFDPLQSGGADWLQGDSGRDWIDAGPGNDLVEGGYGGAFAGDAGGDLIDGGLGDDVLYGDFRTQIGTAIRNGETDPGSILKGDFISGGGGSDWLVGSTARDILQGGGGDDVLVGGAGDDDLRGDGSSSANTHQWKVTRTVFTQDGQTVYQSAILGAVVKDFTPGGADVIYGGAGDDWGNGGAANDFIDAGTGNDVFFGGYGSDIVLGGAGSDVLVGDEGIADAAEGGDYLDGGDGDDTLYGDGGDDILVGGRGNDKLAGGAGKDIYVYEKGDGRDTIDDLDVGGSAASVIHFGPGLARAGVKFGRGSLKISFGQEDAVHVEGFDAVDPTSTPVIGELRFDDGQVMTYADILTQGFDIDGTESDDDDHDVDHPRLLGTGVRDRIRGLGGNDVLVGLGDDDVLDGGAGGDELRGGEGNDRLMGDGIDLPSDEQGDDFLLGGVGDDVLQGDGGHDELRGEEGDDLLIGGAGNDYVAGDGGNDRLFGEEGADTLSGGDGNDLISSGEGNDSIAGDAGDDDLFGAAGNDVVDGGDGVDQLSGNDGNDVLTGGAGDDILFGGAGDDIYVFNQGDGRDYIDDNSGINTVRFGPGITRASVHVTRIGTSQSQGYAFITYGTDGVITIKDGANVNTIQSYVFADGSVSTQAQIIGEGSPVPPGTQYTLRGTVADDVLVPSLQADFQIYGDAGNDVIYGGSASDRIDGGAGDDTLNGLGGANTYFFGRGRGHDTISNAFSGGNDTLEFASDVPPSDVRITHEPNGDLRIGIAGTGDDVTVRDFFGMFPSHLEAIRYGDGTLEDMDGVRGLGILPISAGDNGTVTGTPYDDTLLGDLRRNLLDGQGGNDLLQGGFAADVYVVKPGMGRDAIVEDDGDNILKLSPGLEFRHLTPVRQGDGLFVGILGTEDGALLQDYYVTDRSWQLKNDAGDTKSMTQLLEELADPSAEDSVARSRDAWLAGIRNFAISQLDPGYAPASANLLLKDDGKFQNYYTVGVRTSGSNAARISNRYFWHDIGELADYGIAPVVRTTVELNLSNGSLGLQPASSGSGGLGNGFDSQFLVDYSRTDAQGNPLVIGTPDFSGHWTATYAHLPELQQQATGESAGNIAIPVTVEQTNSISGLTAEFIVGGPADNLFTVFGFVAIDAGPGDDVLNATGWMFWEWGSPAGGNFLYGADGNDRIFGTDAPDVLIGGNGADYLAGMGGHDTYKIFAGDIGKKLIDESVVYYSMPDQYVFGRSNGGLFSRDVVEFSAGIDPDNLQFAWGQVDSTLVDGSGSGHRYATLNLSWAPGKEVRIVLPDTGNADVARLMADYAGESYGIEQFRFADGSMLSMDEMLARATEQAGTADPTRYIYAAGDGAQVLGDLDGLAEVSFGPGIEPSSLLVSGRAGDDVFLRLTASDSLRITDWFATQSVDLRFSDGTVWDAAMLSALPSLIVGTNESDTLYAVEGSDSVLVGLRGDDTFFGASGNDTYLFSRGDGTDYVIDHAFGADPQINTISFTSDIAPTHVGVTSDPWGTLYLIVDEGGARVALSGWFDQDGSGKDFRVRFADGTEWDAGTIEGKVTRLPATPFNDVLLGSDGDDTMPALAGDDLLFAMGGDDVLDGGDGADYLESGEGADILRGGTDADFLYDADGHNLVDGGEGDDWAQADAGSNFWIGGPGADNLEMNGGSNNVFAFNRGDGEDTIPVWFQNNQPLTVSLGGGITLSDLSFVQEGADMVVDAGDGDRVHLSFWSFNGSHAETRLQLIDDGQIDIYDLAAAVEHWESTGDSAPAALQAHHRSTFTDQAFGGGIAYEYATVGHLAAMSAPVLRSFLSSDDFGVVPQPIAFERDEAPELVSPIADQSANEDARFEFTVPAGTFAARDGMTYSATLANGNDLPAWLRFDTATLTFSGTPLQADVGNVDVRLTATVGRSSADDTFVLNVANVNDAPRSMGSLDERGATQGQLFTFLIPDGLFFSDEDPGDTLSLSVTGLPAWLGFDPVNRSLSGTPGNADVGTATIHVKAADSAGATAVSALNVVVANVNDAPTPSDDLAAAREDGVLYTAGNVLSNDGDIDADTHLQVRAPGTFEGIYGSLVLDAGGTFSYALNNASLAVQSLRADQVVFDEFAYAAWDGLASALAMLRVSIAGSNDSPITTSDAAVLVEDLRLRASGNVLTNDTDPDAGSTLSIANPGTYEDAGTRLGRLTLHADGSYEYALDNAAAQEMGADEIVHERFSYLASDGSDQAVGILDVAVHGANDAPAVAEAISDLFATEDESFSFPLAADAFIDADRYDELTYGATRSNGAPLPAWLSFDAATRTFHGTPTNADVGPTSLNVFATDNAGASASQSLLLSVANVNDAPTVVNDIPDQLVEAGTALNFAVSRSTFGDIDVGDELALSVSGIGGSALPSWLRFDPATGTFSGTATSANIGVYGIEVRAADRSGASVAADFALAVTAKAGSAVKGGAGADVIYGGGGNETLSGGGGGDALFGLDGNDVLRGGTGSDVLQGGEGADVLHGGKGNNVLDGGSGSDAIFDGAGSAFIVGGIGADTIRVGGGRDVIAYNRGDGSDTIIGGGDGGNTLSLGGGIRYSDLSFSKSGRDLIVVTGGDDRITLKDWYGGGGNRSLLTLQMIADASEDFDASSSDPLRNRRVETFNFLGLVQAFDQARAQSPGLTSWALTNALLQFHLAGSDDTGLGGDLAYYYGRRGSLAGLSLQAAQQVIGAAGFGADAQQLRPFSGLQDGLVKLGG